METRDHSEFRGVIPFGKARSTKTILGGCVSFLIEGRDRSEGGRVSLYRRKRSF